jgi:hypothetical protein
MAFSSAVRRTELSEILDRATPNQKRRGGDEKLGLRAFAPMPTMLHFIKCPCFLQ